MNLIRSVSLLAALCFAQAAQAEFGLNSPATACVPDQATIRNNRMLVDNASVRHAAGNVEPIALTCPVVPFTPSPTEWALRMTYRDSTGTAAGAIVRARLYRMAQGGNTPALLATVHSNLSADTGLNFLESPFSTHNFNFNLNTYWVRVDLDRAAASQTVIFYSIVVGIPLSSDIRLKHNIALLGHLDNGLGFYRFSYNGSEKAYVGVMAQEVEAIKPDAVVRDSDGYLRVFYDRLGLRMQAFEEWVAAGEKIPMVAPLVRQ
jgi:hypothetical protein